MEDYHTDADSVDSGPTFEFYPFQHGRWCNKAVQRFLEAQMVLVGVLAHPMRPRNVGAYIYIYIYMCVCACEHISVYIYICIYKCMMKAITNHQTLITQQGLGIRV